MFGEALGEVGFNTLRVTLTVYIETFKKTAQNCMSAEYVGRFLSQK